MIFVYAFIVSVNCAGGVCGTAGCNYRRSVSNSDSWSATNEAYVSSSNCIAFGEQQWLGLCGSFITDVSGDHEYRVETSTWGWSSLYTVPFDYYWEGSRIGSYRATLHTYYNAYLGQDYRAQFRVWATDSFICTTNRWLFKRPGETGFTTCNTN
jgi:hypothetical protein